MLGGLVVSQLGVILVAGDTHTMTAAAFVVPDLLLVAIVGGDWTWQVPVAIVACMTLSIAVLRPFARERAPQSAA